MPSEFRCGSCSLRFTVGWYHYHSAGNGYGGMTHFVCSKCGTEHGVEIALRDRGPEQFTAFDISLLSVDVSRRVDAMRILRRLFDLEIEEAREALDSLPMPIARRVDHSIATEIKEAFSPVGALEVTEVGSELNPNHGPLQPDRFLSGMVPHFGDRASLEEIPVVGSTRGPNAEFDLDEQPCAGCHLTGGLLGDPLEVGSTCPHCRELAVECVESWTT